jgi:hypothetical protein
LVFVKVVVSSSGGWGWEIGLAELLIDDEKRSSQSHSECEWGEKCKQGPRGKGG